MIPYVSTLNISKIAVILNKFSVLTFMEDEHSYGYGSQLQHAATIITGLCCSCLILHPLSGSSLTSYDQLEVVSLLMECNDVEMTTKATDLQSLQVLDLRIDNS